MKRLGCKMQDPETKNLVKMTSRVKRVKVYYFLKFLKDCINNVLKFYMPHMICVNKLNIFAVLFRTLEKCCTHIKEPTIQIFNFLGSH